MPRYRVLAQTFFVAGWSLITTCPWPFVSPPGGVSFAPDRVALRTGPALPVPVLPAVAGPASAAAIRHTVATSDTTQSPDRPALRKPRFADVDGCQSLRMTSPFLEQSGVRWPAITGPTFER
jgi:hypothetical protein